MEDSGFDVTREIRYSIFFELVTRIKNEIVLKKITLCIANEHVVKTAYIFNVAPLLIIIL